MRALSNYAWKMSEGCEREGGGEGWVDGGRRGEVRTAEDLCCCCRAPDAVLRFDTWQPDPSVHITISLSEASRIIKRRMRRRRREQEREKTKHKTVPDHKVTVIMRRRRTRWTAAA